jgi:hypothetical protein
MFDSMQGFFLAKEHSDIKNARTELSTHQHDPERQHQFAGFKLVGGGQFPECQFEFVLIP